MRDAFFFHKNIFMRLSLRIENGQNLSDATDKAEHDLF